VITHHAQAKKGVNWGVISWINYAASELNIVQFNALETWAGTPCCGPRRPARRPSHAAPNCTRLAPSQSGAPPTFAASMAAAATTACASAAAAVLQRRWCRDCLAAVLLRTPPPSRPWGEATRLPLQPAQCGLNHVPGRSTFPCKWLAQRRAGILQSSILTLPERVRCTRPL